MREAFPPLRERFEACREQFRVCRARNEHRPACRQTDARIEACRWPHERFPACLARHEPLPGRRPTDGRIEECRWRCEPCRAYRPCERIAGSRRRRERRPAFPPPDERPGASLPGAPWPGLRRPGERIEAFRQKHERLPAFRSPCGRSSGFLLRHALLPASLLLKLPTTAPRQIQRETASWSGESHRAPLPIAASHTAVSSRGERCSPVERSTVLDLGGIRVNRGLSSEAPGAVATEEEDS